MSDEPKFTIRQVPMMDTGIGITQGYESDAAFLAASRAEREQLPQETQDLMAEVERRLERDALFGPSDE